MCLSLMLWFELGHECLVQQHPSKCSKTEVWRREGTFLKSHGPILGLLLSSPLSCLLLTSLSPSDIQGLGEGVAVGKMSNTGFHIHQTWVTTPSWELCQGHLTS